MLREEFIERLSEIKIVDTANVELVKRNKELTDEILRLREKDKESMDLIMDLGKKVILLKKENERIKIAQQKLDAIQEIIEL